jgi:hypothetical protein
MPRWQLHDRVNVPDSGVPSRAVGVQPMLCSSCVQAVFNVCCSQARFMLCFVYCLLHSCWAAGCLPHTVAPSFRLS